MENGFAKAKGSSESDITIGVLALQGAFREHVAHFSKLPGVKAPEVRKKEDLEGLDGLVIPGGESRNNSHRLSNAMMPPNSLDSPSHGCAYEELITRNRPQPFCQNPSVFLLQERAQPWPS